MVTRLRAAFPAKYIPRVDCNRIQADPSWWSVKDAGTLLSRGDASFQYFGSFCAIRKEDKQVESSKIHSEKYEFPI